MSGKNLKNIWSSLAVYYKKDSGNYWDSITPCSIDAAPAGFGKYYLDFSSKARYPGSFDQNGIPLYENSYHPIVICQYALGLYELLLQSNNSDQNLKKKFTAQAEWLIDNYTNSNGIISWMINKRIRGYGLEKPWSSALAQGEAISVLLRAYSLTGKPEYLYTAREALKIFELDINKGGIKSEFKGCTLYEEYPTLKTNFVLNGFLFALFGLYDFVLFDNDQLAKKLFNKGITTLENVISIFDTGYWSQYNLYFYPKKYLASYKYHLIHIEQLKAVYFLSGKRIFLEYSNRWKGFGENILTKTLSLIKKIAAGNIVRE